MWFGSDDSVTIGVLKSWRQEEEEVGELTG